jgi:hypothetical protein
MKKITIAVAMMFAASAYAAQPEFTLVEVEITPTTEAQKPLVVAKWDSRFGAYALENVAAGGE